MARLESGINLKLWKLKSRLVIANTVAINGLRGIRKSSIGSLRILETQGIRHAIFERWSTRVF